MVLREHQMYAYVVTQHVGKKGDDENVCVQNWL